MTYTTLPEPLELFYGKLMQFLDRWHPPLSKMERMWLRVFKDMAVQFAVQLMQRESFALSFDALQKCYERQMAGCYGYLRRTCTTTHLDYLGKQVRPHNPLLRDPDFKVNWKGIDDRMDLEDALRGLGRRNPMCEKVMRIRLRGVRMEEIASEVSLSERHTIRLLQQAQRHLQDRLGA